MGQSVFFIFSFCLTEPFYGTVCFLYLRLFVSESHSMGQFAFFIFGFCLTEPFYETVRFLYLQLLSQRAILWDNPLSLSSAFVSESHSMGHSAFFKFSFCLRDHSMGQSAFFIFSFCLREPFYRTVRFLYLQLLSQRAILWDNLLSLSSAFCFIESFYETVRFLYLQLLSQRAIL